MWHRKIRENLESQPFNFELWLRPLIPKKNIAFTLVIRDRLAEKNSKENPYFLFKTNIELPFI